jgi:histone deacetylase complex regulatory component SIN3
VRNKNKWRKICKENFEKSLDNRSFTFKQTEKKEITQKVIIKDAKDKHALQMEGKIQAEELAKLLTTFKP